MPVQPQPNNPNKIINMSFVRLIKRMFITCMMVLLCFSSFGQLKSIFQNEAEKILRGKINKLQSDTDRIYAEINLAMLYFCQGINNRTLLDSTKALNFRAEKLGRKIRSVRCLNEVLMAEARYYIETGNMQKCERCFREITKNANYKTDTLQIANQWLQMGRGIPPWSNSLIQGRILCFNNALALYRHFSDKQNATSAFKDIADAHLNQGKLDLAENELFQVLNLYKAMRFKNLFDTYYLISQVYYHKGNMHLALYYGLETIKNMKATGDSSNASLFYIKISDIYEDLGMYDDALLYNKRVLDKNKENKIGTVISVKRIIKLLIKENRKAEALDLLKLKIVRAPDLGGGSSVVQNQALAACYMSLGRYKEAGKYIDKMIRASGEINYLVANPMEANLSVYSLSCDFYLITGQYQQGKYYLRRLQKIPKTHITPVYRSQIEMYQSRIDSADGKYAEALKHFQNYKLISDSLFNVTKSKQIEELEINYETRQKDAALTLLKKKSQLQQASIASKNLVANFMIVGFVLLAIIIAGLYNRYLVNKRYNTVLEGTQQEIAAKNVYLEKLLADNEWLLREVHHRVKNNMHVIMGLLQSQSAYLEDGVALNAVRDSRNRVQSMAIIHQKLYMTTNTTEIYLPEFVTDLVDNLKDSFNIGFAIYFNLEIAPVIMDASYVVPLGLILNEAITNAIKHAFPYGGHDTVKISLVAKDLNEFTLIISDNGKGISPGTETKQSKSFGLQLISGLVLELGGNITVTGPPGTALSINFKTVHANRPS